MKFRADFDFNGREFPKGTDAMPILYYVMYTFLLRHAVLDLTNSRDDAQRKKWAEYGYVAVSVVVYAVSFFLEKR